MNISAIIHLGHMAAHVFMATDKGPTCEPVKVGYAMQLLPYINKFMLLRLFSESIREYETLEQMLLSNSTKELGLQECVDICHYRPFKFFSSS